MQGVRKYSNLTKKEKKTITCFHSIRIIQYYSQDITIELAAEAEQPTVDEMSLHLSANYSRFRTTELENFEREEPVRSVEMKNRWRYR